MARGAWGCARVSAIGDGRGSHERVSVRQGTEDCHVLSLIHI